MGFIKTATFGGKLLVAKIESSLERALTKKGEVKRIKQVRFMLMSLRKAHSELKDEHPSLKFGLTRFYELRPTHMKHFDQIPHQVCVCSYHENVRLLLVALKDQIALSIDQGSSIKSFVIQPQRSA